MMTKTEWDQCENIYTMLEITTSRRKQRLFTCAYVRQVWHLLKDNSKETIIVAEKFADGLVDKVALRDARNNCRNNTGFHFVSWYAACHYTCIDVRVRHINRLLINEIKSANKILIFKDIFDPFEKIQKPKTNETIIHFANEIYNNTDKNGFFNEKDLGILADMLYDEGYDNDHLRSGKHIRGCQLIDLILGKQ